MKRIALILTTVCSLSYNLMADGGTPGIVGLTLPTTGVIDLHRHLMDKVNSNFSVIASTLQKSILTAANTNYTVGTDFSQFKSDVAVSTTNNFNGQTTSYAPAFATAQSTNGLASGSLFRSSIVLSTHIANNVIDTNKIIDGEVYSSDIANGTISRNNISGGTIEGAYISSASIIFITSLTVTGTITSTGGFVGNGNKITNLAVTTTSLGNGIVESGNIADKTIVSGDIANATILGSNLANQTLTSSKISSGTIVSSNIVVGGINSETIADNSILSADIADGTIESVDIKDNTITGADIGSEQVGVDDLGTGAIWSSKIQDNTIAAIDIANQAITGEIISSAAVLNIASMTVYGTITSSSSFVGQGNRLSNTIGLDDNGTVRGFARALKVTGAGNGGISITGDTATLTMLDTTGGGGGTTSGSTFTLKASAGYGDVFLATSPAQAVWSYNFGIDTVTITSIQPTCTFTATNTVTMAIVKSTETGATNVAYEGITVSSYSVTNQKYGVRVRGELATIYPETNLSLFTTVVITSAPLPSDCSLCFDFYKWKRP